MTGNPKISLMYFPAKGRAEPVRLTLFLGGIEFEDRRIPFNEFKELKKTLPYGQFPVMEVDGKVLAQSMAQLRYAGKLAKLYPEDAFEAAKVDEIIGVVMDLQKLLDPTFGLPKEELMEARRKVMEKYPTILSNMNSALEKLDTGFSAGSTLTIGDILIYSFLDGIRSGNLDGIPKDLPDKYPAIMKVYNTVHHHPKVQEWNSKQH